jgi:hypothetical protein
MSLQAIWLKILSGKPLTEAEELAWHNRWCEDSPSKLCDGPTELERIAMCGRDPVRNEELGIR